MVSVKCVGVHHVHEHRSRRNGNGPGSLAVHRVEVVRLVTVPRYYHINVRFQHLQANNLMIQRNLGFFANASTRGRPYTLSHSHTGSYHFWVVRLVAIGPMCDRSGMFATISSCGRIPRSIPTCARAKVIFTPDRTISGSCDYLRLGQCATDRQCLLRSPAAVAYRDRSIRLIALSRTIGEHR